MTVLTRQQERDKRKREKIAAIQALRKREAEKQKMSEKAAAELSAESAEVNSKTPIWRAVNKLENPNGTSMIYGSFLREKMSYERMLEIEKITGIKFWRIADPYEHVVGSRVIGLSDLENSRIFRVVRINYGVNEDAGLEFRLDWTGTKPDQEVFDYVQSLVDALANYVNSWD